MSCPVIELAQQLISRPSVSPDDQGCQQLIIERLAPLGFTIEKMPFGQTENLWACRGGEEKPSHLQDIPMLCLLALMHYGIIHLLSRLFVMECYMVEVPPI